MGFDADESLALEALRADPPDAALAWVCRQTGAREVTHSEALRGGISSAIHALHLRGASDGVERVVLRRYVSREWNERDPDLAAREFRVLELARPVSIVTPEPIAFDADGSHTDVPAVLMGFVEGRMQLRPANLQEWLERLAEPLLDLHRPLPDDAGVPAYRSFCDLRTLEVPTWSSAPDAWATAIARLQEPAPAFDDLFLHRDYHPTNVLWKGDRPHALVDWVNACHGPVGAELAHCRLNLVSLYGADAADVFLDAFQRQRGGTREAQAYWDLRGVVEALPAASLYAGWEGVGPQDLTTDKMRARLDEYAARIVRRLP